MYSVGSILETIRRNYNIFKTGLGRPYFMIDGTTNHDRPTTDFLSLDVSTPFQELEKRGSLSYDEVDGQYSQTRRSQPDLILTVNIFSKSTKAQALDMALECVSWFEHIDYDLLSENDIIVVGVEDVQFVPEVFTTEWEHRLTFDIQIRTSSEIVRTVDSMEEVIVSSDQFDDVNVDL